MLAFEDFDQTGRVPSLISVFVGRTAISMVSSCRSLNTFTYSCDNKHCIATKCSHTQYAPFVWL